MEFMSPARFAAATGWRRQTIMLWLKAGKLPGAKSEETDCNQHGRRWLIPAELVAVHKKDSAQ